MMGTHVHEPLRTSDFVNAGDQNTTELVREDRVPADENGATPLFTADEGEDFRSRWEKIQIGFVDDPRKSVEKADELVASVIKRLAEVFADQRSELEHEWDKGDSISTEDLRVSLRRYRSFFDCLLSF